MTQKQYDTIWNDASAVRDYIDSLIDRHPEIFPSSISNGYQLHGHLPESKKLPGIRLRQIRMNKEVFTLRPSFLFASSLSRQVLSFDIADNRSLFVSF
jgi:hypothetical protein